ncbi:hypothetical protein [Actinoplanes sp. RD1]|uniref:hypothetical protein n=1 Tax=Actinoplanes sp. RD1 TaxID=3064538 RepID=UPI0027414023|nr:hypothetical protein [Actinoplanes sp. RD1]
MGVIDLDLPPAARPLPARRRPRVVLAAAGILAAGMALGGAGAWAWSAHHQRAEVAVVLLADAGPQANDGGVGGTVLHGRVTDASLTRRVVLVNAGPLPIDLRALETDRPGLTLHGTDQQRWIEPGQSTPIDADIRILCRSGLPITKLPVRLTVRTADNRERTAVTTLDAGQWNEPARIACAGDLL